MNLEDKLKEKFGNQNPFSVPENYFDDFANKMQDLVKEESPVYRMEVQSQAIPLSGGNVLRFVFRN